ncbi:MAG: YgiT-type zinc finger protein [Candidatus Methanoperedens sp.]
MGNEVNVRGNQLECYFCGDGELKKSKTSYALNRMDYQISIDVSALICSQCNEIYFENETVDYIQNIVKNLDSRINKLMGVVD